MSPRTFYISALVVFATGVAVADRGRPTGTLKASVREPIALEADDLKWGAPPASLPAGAQVAVLEGNPATANRLFTMRAKMRADYKIMPHWHPADEHLTVISGEVAIGHGDSFNEESMQRFSEGGYIVLPAKHHHYFMATKDAVIQLHGVGPWAINYIDPAHDPRKQEPEQKTPRMSRR